MAIISFILLLPLYLTGKKGADGHLLPILGRMTLLSASDEEYRIWIVFFITAIFSIMGHVMIHKF